MSENKFIGWYVLILICLGMFACTHPIDCKGEIKSWSIGNSTLGVSGTYCANP